ncbi:hypothetical protein RhiirA5_445605 [Rhizophagus irregularis]|uniref:Uncharacterized protein n=1 Tax=Rhizophagus irregularis TaxID=588596 RepID=A0A2N0NCA1_9GLOM|nr:hypothetical protein RhiirA5_445605 [Rhizophagus irregularis]
MTTKSTYELASQKLPEIPLLQWKTFLNEALIASNYSNEYFILFHADNVEKLESLNDTEVVTTGEVNPE